MTQRQNGRAVRRPHVTKNSIYQDAQIAEQDGFEAILIVSLKREGDGGRSRMFYPDWVLPVLKTLLLDTIQLLEQGEL